MMYFDDKKLERNYIKNPLLKGKGSPSSIKGEMPSYNDLYYLYIELNNTREELLNYFNCSATTFKRWCKKLNIKKPTKLLEKNAKKGIKQKYGVNNYSQTISWKEYMKKNKKEINEKVYSGMKKNKNFGKSISKEEKEIGILLKEKYPMIKTQYYSEKYPFKCDFYIPEIDTYIEYQGFWKHGPTHFLFNNKDYNCHCPYNKKNKIHKEVIKLWESKNSVYYNSAIDIWTVRDVLKRKTARKNKLNYLEFFSIEDFINWFTKGEENE